MTGHRGVTSFGWSVDRNWTDTYANTPKHTPTHKHTYKQILNDLRLAYRANIKSVCVSRGSDSWIQSLCSAAQRTYYSQFLTAPRTRTRTLPPTSNRKHRTITIIDDMCLPNSYTQVSWRRTCEPIERHVAYSNNIFKCWFRRYRSEYVLRTRYRCDHRNYGKFDDVPAAVHTGACSLCCN